jgi:hypothetical protein
LSRRKSRQKTDNLIIFSLPFYTRLSERRTKERDDEDFISLSVASFFVLFSL